MRLYHTPQLAVGILIDVLIFSFDICFWSLGLKKMVPKRSVSPLSDLFSSRSLSYRYLVPFLILMVFLLSLIASVFFLTSSFAVRSVSLFLFFIIFLLSFVFFHLQFLSPSVRFHRKYVQLKKKIFISPLSELQEGYRSLYDTYRLLSDFSRKRASPLLEDVHQRIESFLVLEKKVQRLSEDISASKSLSRKKALFRQLVQAYRQFPEPLRSKYYNLVSYTHNLLVRGK
jgi:hypothetical protein